MSRVLVIDASIVVDLLGRFDPAPLEQLLFAAGAVLVAPALLDIEVLQVLRRLDTSRAPFQAVAPMSWHHSKRYEFGVTLTNRCSIPFGSSAPI